MRIGIILASLATLAIAAPAAAQPHHGRDRGYGRYEGPRHYEGRRDAWRHDYGRGHRAYGYGRGYYAPPPYYGPRTAYRPPAGVFIPFR